MITDQDINTTNNLTISKHNDPYPLIKKSGYKMDDGVAHCYKFILKGNLYHLH